MRADDDGFVNSPKKITRFTGASDDDIKVLIGKRFIIPLTQGLVTALASTTHPKAHTPNEIQGKNIFISMKTTIPSTPQLSQVRDEPVDEPSTQVRLGKDRLGKVIVRASHRPRRMKSGRTAQSAGTR